jgi:hypothetical protein
MALNTADALGIAIDAALTPLFANPAVPPAQLDVWKAIAGVIASHVVANLEINGVIVDAAVPMNAVLVSGVPVPSDGGAALQTAWVAATGAPQPATQNNNGTGLVA